MGLNRRERGIGLLELMLSLAVIAILLVMATRFFGVTHRAQAVNHATKEVTVVLAGMQHWRGVHSSYNGLSFPVLAAQGLTPDDISADGVLPSWGGCEAARISLGPEGVNHGHARVVLSGLDDRMCQALADRFNESSQMIVGGGACITDRAPCRSQFVLHVGA